MNIGDECPKCGSILSLEEADWGCYCCDYEAGDELDDDDDNDFDWDDHNHDEDELPYDPIS